MGLLLQTPSLNTLTFRPQTLEPKNLGSRGHCQNLGSRAQPAHCQDTHPDLCKLLPELSLCGTRKLERMQIFTFPLKRRDGNHVWTIGKLSESTPVSVILILSVFLALPWMW